MPHTMLVAQILYQAHQEAAMAGGYGSLGIAWDDLADETRLLWARTVENARLKGLQL